MTETVVDTVAIIETVEVSGPAATTVEVSGATAVDTVTVVETVEATIATVEIVEAVLQGPPGVPGDAWLPDPATLDDGLMFVSSGGSYVAIDLPAGTGDMQTLIYDPQGRSTNAFLLDNQSGILDAGVFT